MKNDNGFSCMICNSFVKNDEGVESKKPKDAKRRWVDAVMICPKCAGTNKETAFWQETDEDCPGVKTMKERYQETIEFLEKRIEGNEETKKLCFESGYDKQAEEWMNLEDLDMHARAEEEIELLELIKKILTGEGNEET